MINYSYKDLLDFAEWIYYEMPSQSEINEFIENSDMSEENKIYLNRTVYEIDCYNNDE